VMLPVPSQQDDIPGPRLPSPGSGTSVRTRTDGWHRARSRSITPAWAVSRSGDRPGKVRTDRSRPTASSATTACSMLSP
jgi:hypothetical protein